MEKIHAETFWDFKGEEYSDNKFLMATPYPVAAILAVYLWFVLKFGPQYMKDRQPYNLKAWLLFYNAAQVVISVILVVLGSRYIWRYGLWHTTCYCERDGLREQLLDGSHYYFLTKVLELTDTICFVLRKRQRQVTFLHVYHHSIMVMATWAIVKYSRTDNTVFLGVINSLVHVVMYAYYGLSVFPELHRFLWWKKYITQMQLVQFSLMFLHIVVGHAISECRPAYILLVSVCFNTVLFMYLFGDFYVKSYVKKYTNMSIVNAGKKIGSNIGSNIGSKNGIKYIVDQHILASKIH
ncbi:elongation of very long chain fatty acids protein F [Spodoptera frugiperda]|uniref:Elongation of very long chain fatty acids protein n=1 Tax=Spodoptera frugiperda TaxID=7108 RepID=A0A2H1WH44_SPOFR|nr:elongation of very long chain fatty acids protein F [Spodoptera frugiperda]